MNGIQKVIKYCAMAFAIFLAVTILGSIIAVVGGITVGIAGVNSLMPDYNDRIHLEEKYTMDEVKSMGITSILIDCSAEISVVQGDILSIDAVDVTDEYEIRCEKGEFSIVQDRDNVYLFQFPWLEDVTIQEKVVVTIPTEYCPERVMIKSGSGRVSVADLETARLCVDSGSGKVTMKNVIATTTELETGSGSVEVEGTGFGQLVMKSGSGRVNMKDVVAYDAKFDSGSGAVVYEGELTGNCEFETGSGSLTLKVDGQEEDYRIKAECGSGTFRINGKRVDDGSYGTNVKGEFVIDSGSGSVNVTFHSPEAE